MGYTVSRYKIAVFNWDNFRIAIHTKVEFGWGRRIVWIYFRLNQIKEAAARHLGKFRMNIGLSLECVI